MRNYFYPSPGSNFHIHSWESWNKLGSSLLKKSSTPKHHSKSRLNPKFSSIQISSKGHSNPSITVKKASNYVKYNRKKSDSHLDIFQSSDDNKTVLLRKSLPRPIHLFESPEIAIHLRGTRIQSSRQKTNRKRPVSSKTLGRARTQQRSYTTAKQMDELETPTPW
jgi:hypothetical protein